LPKQQQKQQLTMTAAVAVTAKLKTPLGWQQQQQQQQAVVLLLLVVVVVMQRVCQAGLAGLHERQQQQQQRGFVTQMSVRCCRMSWGCFRQMTKMTALMTDPCLLLLLLLMVVVVVAVCSGHLASEQLPASSDTNLVGRQMPQLAAAAPLLLLLLQLQI
jgi:hypothetical protein